MILVLGGTGEARELADALDEAGVAVLSSLAGRVSNPRLPRGEVRVGGFGGPETSGGGSRISPTRRRRSRRSAGASCSPPAARVWRRSPALPRRGS